MILAPGHDRCVVTLEREASEWDITAINDTAHLETRSGGPGGVFYLLAGILIGLGASSAYSRFAGLGNL